MKKIITGIIIIFAIIGVIFTGVFVAMQFNLLNVRGSVKERNSLFPKSETVPSVPLVNNEPWAKSPDWGIMTVAFTRDADTIRRAARDADIDPRILLGGIIGEQFRFFSNYSRETFKNYFEPLKILASLSKFSYGIAGLKPETVADIDTHLTNPDSVFYLGKQMEQVITYPENSDHDAVRFARITDTKDSYYSYLYVGLYMKQIIAQWERAGYDISDRAGILATLYNLGFHYSKPNANPQIGGAPVMVGGKQYSFGALAEAFYDSDELIDIFPKQ